MAIRFTNTSFVIFFVRKFVGIALINTHKQDTQYTYNVTLRAVRVTIVVVEKQ